MQSQNMNRALRAWGANPPEWVRVLARECDTKSQTLVGRELDCSPSAVNQVLARSYQGRLDRIEQKVRGRYMAATVACPVLGQIPSNECLGHQGQAKRFKPTNPLRRALFVSCQTCPNRESPREESPNGKPASKDH